MQVVTVGMGPIGHAIAGLVSGAEDLELVGTVDPVPERALEGTPAMASVEEIESLKPGVAIVATGSTVSGCAETFESLLRAGWHVVSTCEELTFPDHADETAAARLDQVARGSGTVLVGCGVNPGFLMDVLPSMIATASLDPTAVTVRRLCDLSKRRDALSAKVGVGLAVEDWHARHAESKFGHVGLVESALLCCAGLGWTARSASFERTPREREGRVTGIHELANVEAGGSRIELELIFDHGGEDLDRVRVEGDPTIEFEAPGGVHGDRATAARAVHTARCVEAMGAGLRLPLEVPAGRVGTAIGSYEFTSQG